MIFPKKHLEHYRELSVTLAAEIHRVTQKCLDVLDRQYHPHGFNVGWNLGKGSGASIPHLHCHIVPRYAGEAGFIDLLGDTRVIVEHPRDTQARLRKAFRTQTGRGKKE
jgi:ATP adenylyltransferase